MSFGTLLLHFQRKYKHGLTVAHYRDRVRPRILQAPPILDIGNDSAAEIHVLSSNQDLPNLLWTLYSFYHYSNKRYGLVVHDDGTFTPHDIFTLHHHFPGALVIERTKADAEVLPWLDDFPRCQIIRKLKIISAKEFDFVFYQNGDRTLVLDSDLLFFKRPDVLLEKIENPAYRLNVFNRDSSHALSLSTERLEELFGIRVLERYNSGLGLTHRGSILRESVEAFLGETEVLNHPWRFEQTLHALCSCRFGAELLSPEYDVIIDGAIGDRPVRHYVGEIRHLMYNQGMRRLVENGFLRAIGAASA